MNKKISLIVATIGRTSCLVSLLKGLADQNYQNFEVIIVDQNKHDLLSPILAQFSSITIKHLKSSPGLSKARNIGIQHASGDIFAFPDDDCEYLPNTMQFAVEALQDSDVVIGQQINTKIEETAQGIGSPMYKLLSLFFSEKELLFFKAPSITLFFNRHIVDTLQRFDESLGAGAPTPWKSGEDTDFLVRAFDLGAKIKRVPSICVYHPDPSRTVPTPFQKGFHYGRGRGGILLKHNTSLLFKLVNVAYPFVVVMRKIRNLNAIRYSLGLAAGRVSALIMLGWVAIVKRFKSIVLYFLRHKKIARVFTPLLLKIHNAAYLLVNIMVPSLEQGGLHPKHRITKYHSWFVETINPEAKVLDIGCGHGALANSIAAKAGKVVGIDICEANILKAQTMWSASNVTFIHGDALQYLPDESFDYVVLSNVLEHIEDRVAFLEKCLGHCPPHSIFLIRVPLITRDWIVPYKKELGIEWRLDKTHYTEYTVREFVEEINEAGFSIKGDIRIAYGELFVSMEKKSK